MHTPSPDNPRASEGAVGTAEAVEKLDSDQNAKLDETDGFDSERMVEVVENVDLDCNAEVDEDAGFDCKVAVY